MFHREAIEIHNGYSENSDVHEFITIYEELTLKDSEEVKKVLNPFASLAVKPWTCADEESQSRNNAEETMFQQQPAPLSMGHTERADYCLQCIPTISATKMYYLCVYFVGTLLSFKVQQG